MANTNALIQWPSPAKLNLFLHIVGRLPNGYHQLQSLFQLLDCGDSLCYDVTDKPELVLTKQITGVATEDNLIFRAAALLQKETQCTQGARISLHKQLPMGGGIGGGSSNAATTLLALNHLWNTGLTIQELAKLGLQLGADVPIFVEGRTAFAQGVGEQLVPLSQPENYYVVLTPDCHVSTAEIFAHPALPRNSATIEMAQYQFGSTRNDCQELVFSLYPEVAKLFSWLIEYAPSRMTGTGASVFAVFSERQAAETCFQSRPKGCRGFVAKGVNRSPVHALLATLNRPTE